MSAGAGGSSHSHSCHSRNFSSNGSCNSPFTNSCNTPCTYVSTNHGTDPGVDVGVDMSDIRCTFIRRDLEQVEADLEAVKNALSMAQEDCAAATLEREIRQARQEATLLEQLKKDFADLPGPFPGSHSRSVDPGQMNT